MSEIPQTMRAFVLTGHGGMDKLEWREDWPTPVPGADEALVRVLACGLNNTDVNTRVGWYSAEMSADAANGGWGGSAIAFPRIQGADICGEVVAGGGALNGKRVLVDTWLRDWNNPHDRTKCGYVGSERDGGFAEYCALPARQLHRMDDAALSAAELSAFPTSAVTALNMARRAEIGAGDRVLITGASGGVGGFLVQLVKAFGGTAIAMCGREKWDEVKALGADAVLERAPADLPGALRAALGEKEGREVSVAADVVGGAIWGELLGALGRRGRYVCSGAIAGAKVDFDLRPFYLNDLTLLGATTTPPELFGDLAEMIRGGVIRPMLAATWPLRELKTAQEAFLSKKHSGKLAVVAAEE